MQYCFFEQKVAIQFHLKKLCKPDGKATAHHTLASKIMKLEGWEVLDLDESEFKTWDYQKRIDEM